MKIYRPLWEDGAALAPQQFQQQARWNERVADMVARMGISHPWGVVAAEFDDAVLALSRLNATRLVVRFQDGTAAARVRMSLDTVPEQLTRIRSQITSLEMEKQALLEDIAVGTQSHGERPTGL